MKLEASYPSPYIPNITIVHIINVYIIERNNGFLVNPFSKSTIFFSLNISINNKNKFVVINIIKSKLPENTGAILRTAAVKKNERELTQDLEQLLNKWQKIKAKFDSVVEGVKSLAAKLPKAVRKVLGIASPSKVMIKLPSSTDIKTLS